MVFSVVVVGQLGTTVGLAHGRLDVDVLVVVIVYIVGILDVLLLVVLIYGCL